MKRLMIILIKLYQKTPLPSHGYCQHHPTCSNYMIEALEEYGSFKGVGLGLKRILNCRPFGTYGYDPLPRKEKEK